MSSQYVVLTCPHCGSQQMQILETSQGSRKSCSYSKGGCGETYYVQTDYNGLIERIER